MDNQFSEDKNYFKYWICDLFDTLSLNYVVIVFFCIKLADVELFSSKYYLLAYTDFECLLLLVILKNTQTIIN